MKFFAKKGGEIMAVQRTREDKDEKEKVILRLLEEGYNTAEIAQRLGYKDRDSVGKYMRRRGYEWDEKEETYLLPGGEKHNNKGEGGKNSLDYEHEISRNNRGIGKSEAENRGLSEEEVAKIIQYLPTLEKLHEEKETLGIILEENGDFAAKRLPRYLISGEEELQSFKLPDALCKLMSDYCKEFRISKKEIIVIALVEFFRKYGRKMEIDEILGG